MQDEEGVDGDAPLDVSELSTNFDIKPKPSENAAGIALIAVSITWEIFAIDQLGIKIVILPNISEVHSGKGLVHVCHTWVVFMKKNVLLQDHKQRYENNDWKPLHEWLALLIIFTNTVAWGHN